MELLVVCTDKSTRFKKEKSGLHGMLSVLRFAQKFSIRNFSSFSTSVVSETQCNILEHDDKDLVPVLVHLSYELPKL